MRAASRGLSCPPPSESLTCKENQRPWGQLALEDVLYLILFFYLKIRANRILNVTQLEAITSEWVE